jgi:hypothetical protein
MTWSKCVDQRSSQSRFRPTQRKFDWLACTEARNKSELFREMLRVYRGYRQTRSFGSLQRYGAARARRLGIRDERDVERLIGELRGS